MDTIVALSTGSGGAIAVIRLSGPEAIMITDIFFKGKKLVDQQGHTLHYGTIWRGDKLIDEVVAAVYKAPHSYTREDVVEISCHGSAYIINEILKLAIEAGAKAAKPGEFTMRAFLNGGLKLHKAEAVADLIASNSAAAHEIAVNQMRGGFTTELAVLREQLINFASLIELELDFAEEDIEFADRAELAKLVKAIRAKIDALIYSFKIGNAIKNGVPVVIAGRPNVGKSTLLNKLLNEERAIVSDIAGTTRDTVEDDITINGILFRFIDTAGIRDTDDAIEAQGVARARAKMESAAVIIYMVDVWQDTEEVAAQLQDVEKMGIPYILAVNKADENARPQDFSALHKNTVYLTAKNGAGVPELKDMLLDIAGLSHIDTGEVIITNIRHVVALSNANDALQRVVEALNAGGHVTSDFIALDIKQALHYIGEITGEVSTDDLLDNIFSNFCIGK